MNWQILLFFVCMGLKATSTLAAPQQEQKTQPLETKKAALESIANMLKHAPKKDSTKLANSPKMTDQKAPLAINIDMLLPSPDRAHRNSNIYYNESKTAPSAQEINKKAMNDLIISSSQTFMNLNQKYYNSSMPTSPKSPR